MAFITKRGDLEEADVNSVLGYPIDTFQQGCLKVIVKPDVDLLAMAPTGSGKTAVALMAILQAFRRGKKAVYTSPIKALSNQKYAEFKGWFAKRNLPAAVTLLTGDIKIRAPPGTQCELIICTSEILRNKLVKNPHEPPPQPPPAAGSGGAEPAPPAKSTSEGTSMRDLDLDNLGVVASGAVHPSQRSFRDGRPSRSGVVVSDEIHYINDSERGTAWAALRHLP